MTPLKSFFSGVMDVIKTSAENFMDVQLEEMVRRILAIGNPEQIILFGSRAREGAQPDSDYDLLLSESSGLPRYKQAARYRRALVGGALAKDILVWTPEEVAEWRNVPNAFITTILNDGIVLYERQE